MKKNLLSILTCLLLVIQAFSQDIHFSQFNESPSLVNPATTGSAAVIRASVIYKDQWRSVTVPYKTFGGSFDMKIKPTNWTKMGDHRTEIYKQAFNRLGAGLSFYNDKAGDGNMGTTQVNLSLATFVPLTENSYLSAGVQGSLVQHKIDFSKLVFPNQYNGTTYDPNVTSGENFTSNNFIYPDFAAGVLWNYGYTEKAIGSNEKLKANIGAAMYHIGQPAQKYVVGTSDKLNSKFVIHGDLLYGIKNTNLGLEPSFLIQLQKPSKEIVVGMMFKYYFKEDSKYTGINKQSAFSLGLQYRNKDAIILRAMVEYREYAIGVAYDINTSSLTKASTGRGGPEIFIRYTSAKAFLYQNSKSKFK